MPLDLRVEFFGLNYQLWTSPALYYPLSSGQVLFVDEKMKLLFSPFAI